MLTFTAAPSGTKCQAPCLGLLCFFLHWCESGWVAAGSPPSPPSPTPGGTGPGRGTCPGPRAPRSQGHLISHPEQTQPARPACPATTPLPRSLPHALPAWALLKLIDGLDTNTGHEAEGLRGPGAGAEGHVPGAGSWGRWARSLLRRGKSSVVPSAASPSARVLAALAARELRSADSGDAQPCGVSDPWRAHERTGTAARRARAMPSACPGAAGCPAALQRVGAGLEEPRGVRASLGIWGAQT